ncbi:g5481 [Coccomyxa elongata]
MGNQPEPVLFPRKALNQVFAVLLMRSAYDAVDSLDFIPMGDLTDPSYFDFITFAQLATISQEIPLGQQAFEEFCEECEGQKQTIQRSPSMQSNAALPAAFERITGDLIYDGLCNGFRGVNFGAPGPAEPRTPIQELAGNAQRILDIFTANGYAIKATVSEVVPSRSCGSVEWHGACPSAGTFRVRLEGPATLWGTAALENRRAIASAYDAMAIEAYLRHSGCSASYSVRHTDTAVEEYWTVA